MKPLAPSVQNVLFNREPEQSKKWSFGYTSRRISVIPHRISDYNENWNTI